MVYFLLSLSICISLLFRVSILFIDTVFKIFLTTNTCTQKLMLIVNISKFSYYIWKSYIIFENFKKIWIKWKHLKNLKILNIFKKFENIKNIWKFLHFEPIQNKKNWILKFKIKFFKIFFLGQVFYSLQKKINWEFISEIKAFKIMFEND